MTYAITGKLGVDLDAASSTQGFALGEKVQGVDGNEWEYVTISGSVTQYDAVGIDENRLAASLTKGMADDGYEIGFAQIAFTSGQYGWVAKRGSNIKVRLAVSCLPDVTLYTTSTAGVLDDTSGSQTNIDGIVAVATASSTNAATEIIATYPRSTTF